MSLLLVSAPLRTAAPADLVFPSLRTRPSGLCEGYDARPSGRHLTLAAAARRAGMPGYQCPVCSGVHVAIAPATLPG